jgi:hypothetical protein
MLSEFVHAVSTTMKQKIALDGVNAFHSWLTLIASRRHSLLQINRHLRLMDWHNLGRDRRII